MELSSLLWLVQANKQSSWHGVSVNIHLLSTGTQ